MVAKPCERLSDLGDAYKAFDVIGIDEGQFFPDLNEFCERAANEGKVVIVAALDGTFERKPFGAVCDLVPLAEHVEKLTAVCRLTGGDASFSRRLGSETAVELIGGADMYMPVSRRGFYAPAEDVISPRALHPGAGPQVRSFLGGVTGGPTPFSALCPSGRSSPLAAALEVMCVGDDDDATPAAAPEERRRSVSSVPHAGSVSLILGPMFSGKSTELMRRVRRFTFANRACLVCKYAKDQRYADEG